MKIGAIILAAGRSRRFAAGNKLLHEIDGVAMVRLSALSAAASPSDPCILVVAAGDTTVEAAAGAGRWRVVTVAADAEEAQSASLRAGLMAVADCDGAMVFLGDMPFVPAGLAARLIDAFAVTDGRAIVFPRSAQGKQGHPVLWPRSMFSMLTALSGDSGGKPVLKAHSELWHAVPCDEAGAFRDIDTLADLGAGDEGRH